MLETYAWQPNVNAGKTLPCLHWEGTPFPNRDAFDDPASRPADPCWRGAIRELTARS